MIELRPGEMFADYRIEERIGVGGMGAVYRARHPRLGRDEALKLLGSGPLLPEARPRFEREAQLAGSLSHPHIVAVHNYGIEMLPDGAECPWLAMAFVDAPDAARRLADTGPIPSDVVADICDQIAAALDYAHSQNVLHRDVKPANILLPHDASGRVHAMLADFGIAADRSGALTDLTGVYRQIGTPIYMAPERRLGADATPAADQFALAATGYELLTGRRFADGAELRSLPPSVAEVFDIALNADPGRRFASCRDFAAAFRSALRPAVRTRTAPVSARPQSPAQPPPAARTVPHEQPREPSRRRNGLLIGAIAVVVLLAGAVGIGFWAAQGGDDLGNGVEAADWGSNSDIAAAFPTAVSDDPTIGRTCHNAVPDPGTGAARAISCQYADSPLTFRVLAYDSAGQSADSVAEVFDGGFQYNWEPWAWLLVGPRTSADEGWAYVVFTGARDHYLVHAQWPRSASDALPQRPGFNDLDPEFTNWLSTTNFAPVL